MFSSLTGMPLSEYVRRRRMTVAAADVIAGAPVLDIAVQFGYCSAEAFGRAFRAVHGAAPADVRNDGGPLRSQPQLRLRLTIEGNTSMDTRITDRPEFRLVGHATRVPRIHTGRNPHIEAHIASLPADEHARLKELANTELRSAPGQRRCRSRLHRRERAHVPAWRRTRRRDDRTRRPRGDRDSQRHLGSIPLQRGPTRLPCKRATQPQPPSGSRRTRGYCAPAPRSSQSSIAPRTSAPRPPSSGCRSNAHVRTASLAMSIRPIRPSPRCSRQG
nr:helix-turn-helix domain-containing protein [Gordonia polyisoprenivorans]